MSDISSLQTKGGPAPVTALKAASVGTGGAIVQSAGLIAPAVGLTSANVFIAGLAGEAAPLTMVVGTIVCLCFAKAIGDYARKLPSAGSFYTYLTKTFDARVGFVAGALLFLAYLLLLPFQISFVGLFIQNLISSHANIPWQVFAAVIIVVSTGLAVAGVQPALRVALGLLAVELFAFSLLALLIIVQGGATGNSIQPFNPGQSLTGFSGIALSVVFTIFLFAGFESSTALGEEAKDVTRTIPRALLGVVLFIGVFFIIVTYAETIGFGLSAKGITAFSTDQIPFNDLANRYGNGALSALINVATISSFITVNIVTVNAVARVLFGMGRDKLLPSVLARVNKRQSPHVAAAVVGVLGLVAALVVGSIAGPLNLTAWVAYIATLFFIYAYVMVMIGVPRYYYVHHRSEFNWFTTLIVPIIGLAGVLFVLYGTLHPFPSPPYNYFVFASLAVVVISAAIAIWQGQSNPDQMRQAGQLFAAVDPEKEAEYVGGHAV